MPYVNDRDFEQHMAVLFNAINDLHRRLVAVERRSGVKPSELADLRGQLGLLSSGQSGTQQSVVRVEGTINALKADFEQYKLSSQEASAAVRAELDRITTISNQLATLQAQFDRAQEDELFLSNLAYGYIIMASQWKVARERVRAVVSVPTTSQFLVSVSARAFMWGLKTGLAMVTGGLGTAFFNAFSEPVTEFTKTIPGMESTFKSRGDDALKDIAKDVGKDWLMPGVNGVFDLTVGSGTEGLGNVMRRTLDPGGAATEAADELMDPYEYFLDVETTLRKTAMQLHNNRRRTPDSDAYRTQVVTAFGQAKGEMKLTDLKSDPFWKFLFEPLENGEADAKWAIVTAMFGAQMRRLAWREYCRSQWANLTFDYTMQPNASWDEDTKPAGWPASATHTKKSWQGVASLTDLHYKAWKGSPAHWGAICNDFRGPEHVPGHAVNATGEVEYAALGLAPPSGGGTISRENFAKIANDRKTWISLAVVQCCQVKINRGTFSSSIAIDLEQDVSDTGTSTSGAARLLFNDDPSSMNDTYDALSSKGLDRVAISEVRFGKGKSLGSATGKKGLLHTPNDGSDPMKPSVSRSGGILATITITATARTRKDARIYLVEGAGNVVRDANTGVPTSGNPKLIGTAGLMTVTSSTQNITLPITAPGTYCVTLDGRRDIRKGSKVHFVESTWYFDVT